MIWDDIFGRWNETQQQAQKQSIYGARSLAFTAHSASMAFSSTGLGQMDTPRLTWWDDDKQEERGMALAERRTNGIGGGERLAEARAGVVGWVCVIADIQTGNTQTLAFKH
jgi:hypothetical protein